MLFHGKRQYSLNTIKVETGYKNKKLSLANNNNKIKFRSSKNIRSRIDKCSSTWNF